MTDFLAWIEALTARHQSDLTFAEVSRSLRALSSTYVERRAQAARGRRARGRRQARGVRAVLRAASLPPGSRDRARPARRDGRERAHARRSRLRHRRRRRGMGGACARRRDVLGVDRHPWALDEAGAHVSRSSGCSAARVRADVATVSFPKSPALDSGGVHGERARTNRARDAAAAAPRTRGARRPGARRRAARRLRRAVVEPVARPFERPAAAPTSGDSASSCRRSSRSSIARPASTIAS